MDYKEIYELGKLIRPELVKAVEDAELEEKKTWAIVSDIKRNGGRLACRRSASIAYNKRVAAGWNEEAWVKARITLKEAEKNLDAALEAANRKLSEEKRTKT